MRSDIECKKICIAFFLFTIRLLNNKLMFCEIESWNIFSKSNHKKLAIKLINKLQIILKMGIPYIYFSMFKIGYVDFRAFFDRESDQNEEYCFQKMRWSIRWIREPTAHLIFSAWYCSRRNETWKTRRNWVFVAG